MTKRLTESLSLKLVAIFASVALAFVLVARLGVQWIYDTDYLRALISGHLQLHLHYVREDIGSPPSVERALAITRKVPVDIRISGPDLDWASDPGFPSLSALSWGESRFFGNPARDDTWFYELEDVEYAIENGHRYLLLEQGDYRIAVVTPKIGEQLGEANITGVVIVLGLALLLLCYAAVFWIFRPIGRIHAGAELIGRGDLDHRIPETGNDELAQLTRDINRLADDVSGMLDAKRELLLGISHELRSPLTRMRVALEMVEDEDARRELAEDLAQMDAIIGDLLEGERLNGRHAALYRSRQAAAGLLEEVVAEFPDAERGRIELDVAGGLGEVEWDAARIRLLLRNLLSNALEQSPPGSPVRLEAGRRGERVGIAVADRGPGIDKRHLGRVTEPFFRADRARRQSTGGFGLGLYLADRIAEAHGGRLVIDSERGRGTRVAVDLPVA